MDRQAAGQAVEADLQGIGDDPQGRLLWIVNLGPRRAQSTAEQQLIGDQHHPCIVDRLAGDQCEIGYVLLFCGRAILARSGAF